MLMAGVNTPASDRKQIHTATPSSVRDVNRSIILNLVLNSLGRSVVLRRNLGVSNARAVILSPPRKGLTVGGVHVE